MAIERPGGFDTKVTFVCDGCGIEEDTGESDFRDALDEVKKLGWIIRKESDGWAHYCTRECAR